MKRKILITISILCAVMLHAQDIEQFVNRQMQIYPKSRLLDIYKSCFQDFMGAEHLVSNRERVKAYQHHLSTPHFQAYKQGTLHMVKSLNLLDIQPLDAAAMPTIFRKQQ